MAIESVSEFLGYVPLFYRFYEENVSIEFYGFTFLAFFSFSLFFSSIEQVKKNFSRSCRSTNFPNVDFLPYLSAKLLQIKETEEVVLKLYTFKVSYRENNLLAIIITNFNVKNKTYFTVSSGQN